MRRSYRNLKPTMKCRIKLLLLGMTLLVVGMLVYSQSRSRKTYMPSLFPKLLDHLDSVNTNSHIASFTEHVDKIVRLARNVSMYNRTVLVTMVNDAYLPFTYSWLCNTKNMNVHKSVLIITTDETSKHKLERDWPEISVMHMDIGKVHGNQVYSHVGYVKIMIRRTEMLLAILMANIEIFIFEVDCLWLTNPVPDFQKITGFDVLVNPVAERTGVYAGGFTFLYATENTKRLWTELTAQMLKLGERIASFNDDKYISEGDNDQQYFSSLIVSRYSGVKVKELSLDIYADGKWYSLPEDKRKSSHPLIINNNWVLGNQKKIDRAKQWGHWFIRTDWGCDMEQVQKVVY